MSDGTRGSELPQPLVETFGPIEPERVDAHVASVGDYGVATQALAAQGFVPPDMLCGQTLFILARQPRSARDDETGRASPIAGGVWAREQVTIHRPVRRDEVFTVRGASVRRFVRKGRLFGVTSATTTGADGALLVSNLTTGVIEFGVVDDRQDSAEGMAVHELPVPGVDRSRAADNPSLAELRGITPGVVVDGPPVELALALMLVRDGDRPANPIHSDPDAARRAGLAAPIAGGSHVAAFVFERLMALWGPQVLMHGASIDLRWFAPTFGGELIVPRATVTGVDNGVVRVELAVDDRDGAVKLRGLLEIPTGAPA